MFVVQLTSNHLDVMESRPNTYLIAQELTPFSSAIIAFELNL